MKTRSYLTFIIQWTHSPSIQKTVRSVIKIFGLRRWYGLVSNVTLPHTHYVIWEVPYLQQALDCSLEWSQSISLNRLT